MALANTDNASGNSLQVFAHASINNPTTGTFLFWVYATSVANSVRNICGKSLAGGGYEIFKRGTDGTVLRLGMNRATVNYTLDSAAGTLEANRWVFLAFVFDHVTSANNKIYKGTVNGALTDVTGTLALGSGGAASDASVSLRLLANVDGDGGWPGALATFQMFSRKLSRDECETARCRFSPGGINQNTRVPGCALSLLPGLESSVAPQFDYSGKGNHGTIVGTLSRFEDTYRMVQPFGYSARRQLWIPVAANPIVVTPSTASLTTTTFAPTVHIVTPPTLNLVLSTFAPTVQTPRRATPTTTALSLSTFAPTVQLAKIAVPTTAALTIATFAPSVTVSNNQTVTPATLSLALTSFAPVVSTPRLVTPGVLNLVTSAFAPTVSTPQLVTPGPLSLVITVFAPSTPSRVIPGTASLTLTGFEPTILRPELVTPTTLNLVVSGFAPAVLTPRLVTPGTASLVVTGFAPSIGQAKIATPSTLGLVIATFAPSVLTAGVVTPDIANLTLSAFAPSVLAPRTVTPNTVVLTTTAFAPSVLTPRLATPSTLSLSLTAFSPNVVASNAVQVIPATLPLALTTFGPSVLSPRLVTPSTLTLSLTALAPVVLRPVNVAPSIGLLILNSFVPTITIATTSITVTPGTLPLILAQFVPSVTTTITLGADFIVTVPAKNLRAETVLQNTLAAVEQQTTRVAVEDEIRPRITEA